MIPKNIPVQLDPVYKTDSESSPVSIETGRLVVRSEQSECGGVGEMFLGWVPSPSVQFRLTVDPASGRTVSPLGRAHLSFGQFQNGIAALVTHATQGNDQNEVSGYVESGYIGNDDADLTSVKFHLANFIPFLGHPVRNADSTESRASRAEILADGWRVIVDGIAGVNRDYVATRGGYSITHVGVIERVDENPFKLEQVRELLTNLYWFFSFCRGQPSSPILSIGYEKSGRIVWRELANWSVASGTGGRSWYNSFSASGLELLLPGFLKRMDDSTWSAPTRLAVYWYLEAGSVGGDSTLILAQAAFELLSWMWLVEGNKLLSKAKFNELGSAGAIRKTLESMGIPTHINANLKEFSSTAGRFGWADGPSAIVGLRNALVHPSSVSNGEKLASLSPRSIFEAATLSLWYLELMLLRVFDYSGKYSSRMIMSGWRGVEVESVPWSPAT